MVERKVKPMSVQASPAVKKMISVLKIALGCDQKNASMKPMRAPISHKAMAPTRMPTWVVISAQAGQSFCTGRRRSGRAFGWLASDRGSVRSRPPTAPTLEDSCTVMDRSSASGGFVDRRLRRGIDRFGRRAGDVEQLEAAFLDHHEFRGERAAADARPGERDRDGLDDAARPRPHHMHLVG